MARVALKFMVVRHRKMTADEFLALPPTNGKWELIDGEIIVHDPGLRHQAIVVWLVRQFANWTDDHPGSGVAGIGGSWRMPDGKVMAPDVWFLRQERVQPGDRVVILEGAPDLAVEVRSPNTWEEDCGPKKDRYVALGAELWLVDTVANVVLVHRGGERMEVTRGQSLSTPLMPGLVIDVTTMFDR